jgi:hypothetical protein
MNATGCIEHVFLTAAFVTYCGIILASLPPFDDWVVTGLWAYAHLGTRTVVPRSKSTPIDYRT